MKKRARISTRTLRQPLIVAAGTLSMETPTLGGSAALLSWGTPDLVKGSPMKRENAQMRSVREHSESNCNDRPRPTESRAQALRTPKQFQF